MKKVAIITDSIACLLKEQVGEYGIQVVPASIAFEGKVYREWVDLTPSQAYRLLERNPELFSTAPPSPGDYLEAYRKLSGEAESILCITISSLLSGCYDNALVAKQQAEQELPQTTIEVLDSKRVIAAQGLMVLATARAVAEAKSLSEVIGVAETVRDKVKAFMVLETIRHIYRTGRIPKIASQIGSTLSVKPILSIRDKVHFAGVTRSKQKGVERLLQIMRETVGQAPVHVAVMHADALEEGERLKERVSSEFNCVELFLTEVSPVVGYATGRGTLALAFYPGE